MLPWLFSCAALAVLSAVHAPNAAFAQPDAGEEPQADHLVLAPTAADEATTRSAQPSEPSLDVKLERLDTYLSDLQAPSRAYFYSWATIQLGLIGGQAYLAATTSSDAVRTSNIIGSTVSAASLAVLVLAPWTGKSGLRKFRAMPQRTPEEKAAKVAAGESFVFRQAASDELGTSRIRHIIGLTFGVGAGLAVGLAYEDSLREAIRRAFGIIMVSEIQILTRPRRAARHAKEYGQLNAVAALTPSPWFTPDGFGIALTHTF